MDKLPSGLETHSIPTRLIRIFSVPLLNSIPSWLIKLFMRRTSKDASVVVASGGTTHALEAMYGRANRKLFSRGILQGIADVFWHHIISQPKSIRNRLRIVQCVLEDKIKILLHDNKKVDVSVLSIAGGSSRSLIYAVKNLGDLEANHRVHVVTIDKDASALAVGQRISNELGLASNFEWVHGTASEISTRFPSKKFDIVEIVGLLDYFDDERAIRLLKMSRELMNEGGFIIIANVMPNRERSFVHKTGWPNMIYRKPPEVTNLLIASDFNVHDELFIEPLLVHCVAVGNK